MERIGGVNSQLLQPDNRCFLQDGGSTLTFFVKEDLPVGQQIGRLNIQGRVGRDIDLAVNDITLSENRKLCPKSQKNEIKSSDPK